MIRSVVRILVCLTLFLGAIAPSWAEGGSALRRVVDSGLLRVGTSGNQPPFTVQSKAGTLIGYEVDLARLLATAMGVEVKFVQKPFSELLSALESGEVDVILSGMTMTLERNLRVAFVGPYVVSGKSILTKSKTLAAIQKANQIDQADISLTALEGSTSQRFVENLMPKAKLVTAKDYDAGVKLVLDDEVDALVADFPICALSVLRHPEAGLTTLKQPLTIEPVGIALPPNDSLFLNLVENYLGVLKTSGILEELNKKWFQDGSWLLQIP